MTATNRPTMPTEAPPLHTGLVGLYVITPADLGAQLQTMVGQALDGGARVVQYRDKTTDHSRRLSEARALLSLCQEHGALLIINDDVELARACGAHGVHIGLEDSPLGLARERLGAQAIIGVSCYNRLDLAHEAREQGADYVAFGSVFPSSTKPQAVHAPLSLLSRARSELHLPIAAIGGITEQNAGQVFQAGAHMAAVIQGVFGATDVRAGAARIAAMARAEGCT